MSRPENTASFVVRFTQKIYENEAGETDVQWRGKITHVQDDEQKNFGEIEDAMAFIQAKLAKLTLSSVEDKSEAEQKGILSKSYNIWKKMAKNYPKILVDAIKDPKAQVTQIQEQISQVSDEISSKIEIDDWRPPSKSDINKLMRVVQDMNTKLDDLQKKL